MTNSGQAMETHFHECEDEATHTVVDHINPLRDDDLVDSKIFSLSSEEAEKRLVNDDSSSISVISSRGWGEESPLKLAMKNRKLSRQKRKQKKYQISMSLKR